MNFEQTQMPSTTENENSVIVSHINYSILAWSYEHNRISKRAVQIISLSKYNAYIEPIFKTLKLLKVKYMLKLNELNFYYNMKTLNYQNTSPKHNLFYI